MRKFIKTISIISILALIACLCVCFVGCKDVNVPTEVVKPVVADISAVLISNFEHSKDLNLLNNVTEAGDTNTKLLTAVISEDTDDLADKTLLWSIAFANPSSTWASGKTVTDYVTITPSEDTLTCTLTLVQAFGEQIVVTVKAKSNETATASATVDYVKRLSATNGLTNTDVALNGGSIGAQFPSKKSSVVVGCTDGGDNTYTFSNYNYGVGTITPDLKITSATLTLSDTFYTKVQDLVSGESWSVKKSFTQTIDHTAGSNSFTFKALIWGNGNATSSFGFLTYKGGTQNGYKRVNDYIISAAHNSSLATISISVGFELYNNGTLIDTGSTTLGSYSLSDYELSALLQVNGVSLTPTSFVF